MKLLKEIVRNPKVLKDGKTLCREAVRGIIVHERKLLMIYSTQNGDYKFPGGGVHGDETHEEALVREICEECGATVVQIEQTFGKVIEYDIPLEREYAVFEMTSFYYLCQIDTALGEQHLDGYEENLGFKPVWVDIDVAIRANRSALQTRHQEMPRWTERETFILEQIKERLFAGSIF